MTTGGMDGLSMRRVGEELGAGAASLYWHVRNKDELLQLLFERVTEEVVMPPPDPSRWTEQARELAHQMRDVMNRHRDIARISLGRIPSGPAIARMAEWQFELLLSLPPERYPHTVAAAELLMGGPPEDRFDFGLDVILRGLASYASDAQARSEKGK